MDRLTLRSEHDGRDSRSLWAWVDDAGALHIDGQDLGPATEAPDEEREWFRTIAPEHVPSLLELLGGAPGEPALTVLARYSGPRAGELETILHESGIPAAFHTA